MHKYFVIILLLVISNCFSQNPEGEMYFSLRKGCGKIIFKLKENDSVFYSLNKKYSLKFSGSLNGSKWLAYPSGVLGYSYKNKKNGAASFIKDSTIIAVNFQWTRNLKAEIKNLKSNKKMIIEYENVNDVKFNSRVKFKEGYFKISDLKKQHLMKI